MQELKNIVSDLESVTALLNNNRNNPLARTLIRGIIDRLNKLSHSSESESLPALSAEQFQQESVPVLKQLPSRYIKMLFWFISNLLRNQQMSADQIRGLVDDAARTNLRTYLYYKSE